MFCAKCGAVLADDAKKCNKCGAPVRIRPDREDKVVKKKKNARSKTRPESGDHNMPSQEAVENSLQEEVLMDPVFYKEAGGDVDVDAIIKIARGEEKTDRLPKKEEDDRPTIMLADPDLDMDTYLANLPLMERARRSFFASQHRFEEAADERRMRRHLEKAERHFEAKEAAARKAEAERAARAARAKEEAERKAQAARERAEAQRAARAARERAEAERKARIAREKEEAERAAQIARERAEAERAERAARERAEAERAAQLAREKAEAERAARMAIEKAEAERAAQAARERAEAERAAQAARERAEAERAAQAARERAEAERAARAARERAEAERAAEAARRRDEMERAARETPEALYDENRQLEEMRRLRRYRNNKPDQIDEFLGRFALSKEAAVRIVTLFLIAVLAMIYVLGRGNSSSSADPSYIEDGGTDVEPVEGQGVDESQDSDGSEVPTGGGDFQSN